MKKPMKEFLIRLIISTCLVQTFEKTMIIWVKSKFRKSSNDIQSNTVVVIVTRVSKKKISNG